jgi:hypothetical protein
MQVNVDDYLLEVHPGQVAHQIPAETPKDRCVMPHNPATTGTRTTSASGHEKIQVCGQLAPGAWPSFLQACGH